jgi:aldehyde dehydrogenase (NAD+)
MTYPTYHNLIGGEWMPAGSGKTTLNVNPADNDDIVGSFPSSGPEDVAKAVAAAKKAFAAWRLVPAPKRAEILVRAGILLQRRKEQFARDMTREMGKVLAETRGDVRCRRRPPLIRPDHPVRAPEQVRHVDSDARRRRRPHHAVELSHGHP